VKLGFRGFFRVLKGNKGKVDESFTEITDEMQKYRENESIREARLLVNSSQQISSYLTYLLTLPFIDFHSGGRSNRMDTSAYILTTRIFPSLPYTRSNINA